MIEVIVAPHREMAIIIDLGKEMEGGRSVVDRMRP